jgi:hypothetical protein
MTAAVFISLSNLSSTSDFSERNMTPLGFMNRLFISTYTLFRPSYIMRATVCFKNFERCITSVFVSHGVIVLR